MGYDQVFAAAYSVRPGTPAARLADDVPAEEKRRRLNELLAVQERIGLERNAAWLGRTVEVLVEAEVPPRAHDHDDGADSAATAERPMVSGRTREHKLVHLAGDRSLVGRLVAARIEHAGPYALRGAIE